jgi:hypothetical protein
MQRILGNLSSARLCIQFSHISVDVVNRKDVDCFDFVEFCRGFGTLALLKARMRMTWKIRLLDRYRGRKVEWS